MTFLTRLSNCFNRLIRGVNGPKCFKLSKEHYKLFINEMLAVSSNTGEPLLMSEDATGFFFLGVKVGIREK